jgi:DtxR family transcriptional regulator, Mn-dependent transcriptional regulator
MSTISREDYLKQVYVLQQARRDEAVPMGELASAMGVAAASATGMVKSLVEVGLVEYEPYVGVSLTADGERAALDVVRRHRLIESFLVQTLGLDWSEVHEEAERLEHAVSDKLLAKIDAYLGAPTVDPHGDPIPAASGRISRKNRKTLAQYEAGLRVQIVRVTDQDPEFLRFVDRIGLRPGTEVVIEANDSQAQVVTVRCATGPPISLSAATAAKLLVEPCP